MKQRIIYVVAVAAALSAGSAGAVSPWLEKVYDFLPAPGQFVNVLPEYEDGDTRDVMLDKVREQICGDRQPGMISLGAWGGYVVVGFDHPVVNVSGEYDFKVFGNSFKGDGSSSGGSSEPAIVMVAVDENGNGLADDPWYELAGSDYSAEGTLHGVTVTYHRPDPDKAAEPDPDYRYITDRTYIRWTSDSDARPQGYVQRNSYHAQSYWPEWHEEETLVFKGAMLADNYIDLSGEGTNFVQYPKGWGYADNLPNNEDPGFNIDWAVDSEGRPVHLDKIDFIKIYTAVNQNCGWLGESSAEICGGEDLHPEAVVESSVSDVSLFRSLVLAGCSQDVLKVRSAMEREAAIFAADGRMLMSAVLSEGLNVLDVSALPSGLYIITADGVSLKFVK